MPVESNLGLQTKAEEFATLVESARTTTKKEMVERIAASTNQSRIDVKRTIQAFLDEVIEELGRGNRLEFRDFGVFEIRERAARRAQNPKTNCLFTPSVAVGRGRTPSRSRTRSSARAAPRAPRASAPERHRRTGLPTPEENALVRPSSGGPGPEIP